MKNQKLQLIHENTSPLHRIMTVYDADQTVKKFNSNICAFHIGNGLILSVSHNLRAIEKIPTTLSENYFQTQLLAKIAPEDKPIFEQIYPKNTHTNRRNLATTDQATLDNAIAKLDHAKVDRRYSTLYKHQCCQPYLITSFREKAFCGDTNLDPLIDQNHYFFEQISNRHTYILQLELLEELINEDVAIYKIINTNPKIIKKLPAIDIDFELHDTSTPNYFCLQTAPYDNLGRIINEANIEGLLDNFCKDHDTLGNQYIMDGMRYLIKGFFRFGSSGSPYLTLDSKTKKFKANAIQSQASFIQMPTQNNTNGNRQYLNGIATPLSNIEETLQNHINQAKTTKPQPKKVAISYTITKN